MLWGAAFVLTLFTLVAILLLPHKDTSRQSDLVRPDKTRTIPAEPSDDLYPDPAHEPPSPFKPKTFVYEEKIGLDFDLRVWEADMAILQTMTLLGHDPNRMSHRNVETRFFYGTPYHFQEMVIYTNNAHEIFIQKLKENLERFLSNVALTRGTRENTISISINGQETHSIILERIFEKPLPGSGKLVIIIDDLGGDLKYAKELAKLDFPIIFSVLPHISATDQVVDLARQNNIELMLHLPMEPLGFPEGVDPGPGALFVNMDENEIRRRVKDNIKQVPGAIGVNNHMGSRFTQDAKGMAIVFDELKKNQLFFLDSLTTPKSVAGKLAKEQDIAFLKRNIFLDNVQDTNAIMFQLSKAENIAIKLGMAVAIGHPYPETIKALQKWNSLKNNQVEVVRVSEFISTQRYRTVSHDRPGSLN